MGDKRHLDRQDFIKFPAISLLAGNSRPRRVPPDCVVSHAFPCDQTCRGRRGKGRQCGAFARAVRWTRPFAARYSGNRGEFRARSVGPVFQSPEFLNAWSPDRFDLPPDRFARRTTIWKRRRGCRVGLIFTRDAGGEPYRRIKSSQPRFQIGESSSWRVFAQAFRTGAIRGEAFVPDRPRRGEAHGPDPRRSGLRAPRHSRSRR